MLLKKLLRGKKGVMGIGMLIIFIATILVAAIASGVLIRATGLLQEKALNVEETTRERLVTGIDIQSVVGIANVTSETIQDLEFVARLRAGSTPIRLTQLGLSYVEDENAFSAELNENISGNESCSFDNLEPQTEFCFEPRIGNSNLILEDGELVTIRYRLNSSNALNPGDNFEVSFLAGTGATETLELRMPMFVLRRRIRIR